MRQQVWLRGWTVIAIGCATLGAQPANSVFKGRIFDDSSGAVIAGAEVSYERFPRTVKDSHGRVSLAPGEVNAGGNVTTNAAGGYAVPPLPDGSYGVCVVAKGFLASCPWSGLLQFNLASGQTRELADLRLQRAATVTIRVNDLAGSMPTVDQPLLPLAVGVKDEDGAFHPAHQVVLDKAGRTFQVDVPYGRAMRLWFHSWAYKLTDGNGQALSSTGSATLFQVAQNSIAAQQFSINVVGQAQP